MGSAQRSDKSTGAPVTSGIPRADLHGFFLPRRSTMRCIAERLLPEGHGRTYLQLEIINEKIDFPPAKKR
eukprot:6994711-Prymnesium_polylepis.2